MSQKLKEGAVSDYCQFKNRRVITLGDGKCSGCMPGKGEGQMLAMRGVVVECTNAGENTATSAETPVTRNQFFGYSDSVE